MPDRHAAKLVGDKNRRTHFIRDFPCICIVYEHPEMKLRFGSKRSLLSNLSDVLIIFGQNFDNIAHFAAPFSTHVLYKSLLSGFFILSSQSESGAEAESPTDHPQGNFPGR